MHGPGDDLLRQANSLSKEALLRRSNSGLSVNKVVSDKKLWQLSKDTGAEWAFVDNGKLGMTVRSGNATEVKILYGPTTKSITHTHLTDPIPSLQDFEVLVKARKLGAPVNELRILSPQGSASWSYKRLAEMAAKNQLYSATPLR